MATCTQCGAELKPYRSPPHSPQLCPSPRFSLPRLHRNPHSLHRRPRSRRQAAATPMQAAHLPPRSRRRTQRILTRAMRPAHRRRPAQAHRFTPETHPRLRPHRRMLPMLSRRRHPAARAATLTAIWPPAASPSAPAHQ